MIAIIISILALLLSIFCIYLIFRLNSYIQKLEVELDSQTERNDNLEDVLTQAIKEDYIEKGKTIKVKKPKISKNS